YTPADRLFERTQNTFVRDITRGSDCRYVDTLFPHPYLAFVHHANPPCGDANINNVGLFNDDFPTIRRGDRFTILLTGGSVASQLGQSAKAPPAPKFLEEELNRHYISPNGQPFLVLNGADGGWKEPQQFILFAMYAGSVDAVVTLDGYNEIYFFPLANERLESPLSNFIDANPFVADENFGDAAIGWVMGRFAGALSRLPVVGHSHAVYMIVRGIESLAKHQEFFAAKGHSKRTTLLGLFRLPEDALGDAKRTFAIEVGLYRKYKRGIEAIARDNGVLAAYFLQPVPLWGKQLTEEERRASGSVDYGAAYRRMVDGMMALREGGLRIYDLGDLFEDVKERIYEDHIHFIHSSDGDSPGYRMMAARMGRDLAEAWSLKRRAPEK